MFYFISVVIQWTTMFLIVLDLFKDNNPDTVNSFKCHYETDSSRHECKLTGQLKKTTYSVLLINVIINSPSLFFYHITVVMILNK